MSSMAVKPVARSCASRSIAESNVPPGVSVPMWVSEITRSRTSGGVHAASVQGNWLGSTTSLSTCTPSGWLREQGSGNGPWPSMR